MRPIDADKIIYFKGIDIFGEDVYMAPKDVIDEMPTIEVEPIRHGHWEWDGDYICSNCGERGHRNKWNWCPNCGAKMDEVKEDVN